MTLLDIWAEVLTIIHKPYTTSLTFGGVINVLAFAALAGPAMRERALARAADGE